MERYIYLDGEFVDRVSDNAERVAESFGAWRVKVERFEHPVTGLSERVYLEKAASDD